MSFISKVVQSLSGSSSANLQRIKDAADERRAKASSASLPKVNGDIENTVASMLEKRIKHMDKSAKP